MTPGMSVALPNQEFYGEMEELDRKIDTLMGRGEKMINMRKSYVCQICGKEGNKTNIKDHIEAKHLEGITIPCGLCEKTCRSRDSLRHHMRTHKSQLSY